ncbi:MAG TPA: hypothetical protein VM681_05225 [Candidatus Thermoplasmatota archaeon]|nr:hypothetical protein [Candidatus Thermoplasmatota archaeon]
MEPGERALRFGGAIALWIVLSVLLAWSPVVASVPDVPTVVLAEIPGAGFFLAALFDASPLGFWETTASLLVLAQCLATAWTRNFGVAGWLGACAPVLLLHAYGWSNLDWSRALHADLALAHGGFPAPEIVLVGALPVALALAVSLAILPRQAVAHYRAKGVPAEEVAAIRGVLRPAAGVLAAALSGTAFLALALPIATGALAQGSRLTTGVLLVPVVAAGGLLALLLLSGRRPARAEAGASQANAAKPPAVVWE